MMRCQHEQRDVAIARLWHRGSDARNNVWRCSSDTFYEFRTTESLTDLQLFRPSLHGTQAL